MNLDGLLAVLREHAVNPDEDHEGNPMRDWHWDVNSDAIRMKAYTREVSSDPHMAWQAAIALRDAVVAIGYELRHECEVGAVSEEGPTYDAPIHQWRGYVSLVFATK
jgi:hypothetical protein